jgi:hypothetical protein
MHTFHIQSAKDINSNLLETIKGMFQGQSMTIKIETDEKVMPVFILSEHQKEILDSQKDLSLSDYQDGDNMIKELKENYGIQN